MKDNQTNNMLMHLKACMMLIIAVIVSPVDAEPTELMVDEFTNAESNSLGYARFFLSDVQAGGATTIVTEIKQGVLQGHGKISPPRGQPGWSSSVFLLANGEQSFDASQYSGVRISVKLNKGNLSLSANSAEVTNFDYHSSPLTVTMDGKFHTIDIPFDAMKRVWSEQTPLNTASLNSLSLVAYSMQPADFEFAVQSISFY